VEFVDYSEMTRFFKETVACQDSRAGATYLCGL